MLEWSCRIMWQLESHSILLEMLLQWRHLLPTNRSCPCYLRDLILHENVIVFQNPNKLVFPFNKQFVQEPLSLCIILYVYPVTTKTRKMQKNLCMFSSKSSLEDYLEKNWNMRNKIWIRRRKKNIWPRWKSNVSKGM